VPIASLSVNHWPVRLRAIVRAWSFGRRTNAGGQHLTQQAECLADMVDTGLKPAFLCGTAAQLVAATQAPAVADDLGRRPRQARKSKGSMVDALGLEPRTR
jgi:hypothetical protein